MTDRVERLTNLLALLLETPQPLTLVEIAGELRGQYPEKESTRRAAFERDKRALRDIGVPIETEIQGGDRAGVSVYWIDRDHYELADLHLEPEETRALQMAFAAVRSTSGAGITAGEEALWKVGGASVDGDSTVSANLPELPGLAVLRDAASRRATVSFRYHDRPRSVDPYGLMLRNGFWYVLGRDHGHDEQRTFRVDRIEGTVAVSGSDKSFERPLDFDPREALPSQAVKFGVVDDDTVTAEVSISPDRAVIVEREVGSDRVVRRNDDGAIVIAVPCANLWAFGTWVLGMVDHAEVLSPSAVRTAIVERLQAIADTQARS